MSFVFLFISIIFFKYSRLVQSLPENEYQVLKLLYESTNGPQWKYPNNYSTTWNFTGTHDPCAENWYGLRCTCTVSTPIDFVPGFYYYYDGVGTDSASCNVAKIGLTDLGLTGTLPDEITTLVNLTHFHLASNSLYGPLPSGLLSMPNIEKIEFSGNSFSGQLPNIFSTTLEVIDLGVNSLSLRFPDILYAPSLVILNIYENSLTGPIPTSIGNLVSLQELNLQLNALTGKIPTEIGNMAQLTTLALESNFLSGPIPTELGQLDSLFLIVIGSNFLSGPIPNELSSLVQLNYLQLANNQLKGKVPDFLGTFPLTHFSVDYNYLEGPIPSSFSQLSNLNFFSLARNYFTGELPYGIGSGGKITTFDISDNMFTGFIPSYIKSSASLLILNISHNLLTGDPSTLFDSEVQTKLAFVDMSENQMVGELGDEIFKLPAIQVVAAAVNCLRGPISDNICTANTLKTIALDSMGSASSCLTKVFPIFNTYAENIAITGSLPYCMFNLSMLNTLHLSNNGIEGTLPYDLAIGPDLVDLDLSHNTLKGKLPREICAQNWNNLNLGYNRLDGTLCDGLVVDEKLVLERNRLSGNIPPSYNSIPQISILSDNIFDCSSLTHATLPHLDPASGLYACGSETANISFYIYGGIGLIALVTIVIIYQVYNLDQQLALFTVGGMKLLVSPEEIKRRIDIDTSRFGRMSTYLLHVAGYVGLYLAFGLMVTVLMTHAYSTHDESYAWEFSFGYKGGERAAGVIVVYIGLMAILFYYLLSRYISSQFRHFYRFENLMTSEEHPPEYVTTKHAVFMFSLFLINLIVTVTVNIYFVLNITGVSRQELYLLDLGLAAFKIVWTNVFIDGALNGLRPFYTQNETPELDTLYRTLLILFTNIISPCIGTAIGSKDCFYDVVFPSSAITTEYFYKSCEAFLTDGSCHQYVDESGFTSYVASYTYSYQCSSAILTSYASVFIYTSAFTAFLLPLIRGILRSVLRVAATYSHTSSKVLPDSLQDEDFRNSDVSGNGVIWRLGMFLNILSPQIYKPIPPEKFKSHLSLCYNSNKYSSNLVTLLSAVITFGCAFPPLGFVLLLAVVSQLMMLRIELASITCRFPPEHQRLFLTAVDENFRNYNDQIKSSVYLLLPLGCTFMSFFAFDALGDQVGYVNALWLPLVTSVLLPGIVLILGFALSKVFSKEAAVAREFTLTDDPNPRAIYDPEDADVDNDDSYEHQLKSLSIHYRKSPIEEKYESYEPAPSSPHNKRISDHFKRDNALSVGKDKKRSSSVRVSSLSAQQIMSLSSHSVPIGPSSSRSDIDSFYA